MTQGARVKDNITLTPQKYLFENEKNKQEELEKLLLDFIQKFDELTTKFQI